MNLHDFIRSETFWGAFGAAVALAAAVGAALCFAVAAWLRHRKRQSTEWAAEMGCYVAWDRRPGVPSESILEGHIPIPATEKRSGTVRKRMGARSNFILRRLWVASPPCFSGKTCRLPNNRSIGTWGNANMKLIGMEPHSRLQKGVLHPFGPVTLHGPCYTIRVSH